MFFGGHVRNVDDAVFLRESGFTFGEVVLKDKEAREYWRDIDTEPFASADFSLIAHGPHEGDPNSLENLLQNYGPALVETIDSAFQLGASFLTVHLWMDSRYVKAPQIIEKKALLKDLFCYAAEKHVVLSLENLSESASDLALALEEIPEPSITLDIGHGQLLTEINRSFEIINRLGAKIHHVHAHDNSGGSGVKDDLHLPIGDGIVDFRGIIRALLMSGYDNTITLELKRHELLLSRERLERIFRNARKDIGL
ncbi:MAG: sugar phosphate isomerase/epimerase [Pseudomonadota bacterium]